MAAQVARKPLIVNCSVQIIGGQAWPLFFYWPRKIYRVVCYPPPSPEARTLRCFRLKEKTTEVFQMDKYDIYQINKPIGRSNYRTYGRQYRPSLSNSRHWDRIICTLCVGCGKALGRYENLRRLAFCHECREVLFPETVSPRSRHSKPTGHFRYRPRARTWQYQGPRPQYDSSRSPRYSTEKAPTAYRWSPP